MKKRLTIELHVKQPSAGVQKVLDRLDQAHVSLELDRRAFGGEITLSDFFSAAQDEATTFNARKNHRGNPVKVQMHFDERAAFGIYDFLGQLQARCYFKKEEEVAI